MDSRAVAQVSHLLLWLLLDFGLLLLRGCSRVSLVVVGIHWWRVLGVLHSIVVSIVQVGSLTFTVSFHLFALGVIITLHTIKQLKPQSDSLTTIREFTGHNSGAAVNTQHQGENKFLEMI